METLTDRCDLENVGEAVTETDLHAHPSESPLHPARPTMVCRHLLREVTDDRFSEAAAQR